MFYVILTDGAVDQIAEGAANAKRERRDLEKMGFKVVVFGPCSSGLAQDISDAMECGRMTHAHARKLIQAEAK